MVGFNLGHVMHFCRSFVISLTFLLTSKPALTQTKERLSNLEQEFGGRLGVAAIDIQTGSTFSYRADERFPLCSTFKILAVGAVLKRNMESEGFLKKMIRITKEDVLKSGYAPITKNYIDQGMSVYQLAAAAIQYSDNAAINLLIRKMGGLKHVNQFARSIGDQTFRIDRWEPTLNSAIPGDPKDTSTPLAMSHSLKNLAFDSTLNQAHRHHLIQWLMESKTGANRIRASLPQNWKAGDKTGTCSYGTSNDIAIVWNAEGEAFIIAVYYTQSSQNAKPNDLLVQKAAKTILNTWIKK